MVKSKPEIKRLKGFSLPEIVVACGILVALGTGAAFIGNHVMKNGRFNAARADVSAVAMAVMQYKFEIGSYPASLNDMTAAVGNYGPWLHEDGLRDPWNELIEYYQNGSQFAVWSKGPDRVNNSGSPEERFLGDDIGILGH